MIPVSYPKKAQKSFFDNLLFTVIGLNVKVFEVSCKMLQSNVLFFLYSGGHVLIHVYFLLFVPHFSR